jgi:hypothetical protein
MSDKNPVQNPKGDLLRLEKKTGYGATTQLAEKELERIVGGYIGETEKNLI